MDIYEKVDKIVEKNITRMLVELDTKVPLDEGYSWDTIFHHILIEKIMDYLEDEIPDDEDDDDTYY